MSADEGRPIVVSETENPLNTVKLPTICPVCLRSAYIRTNVWRLHDDWGYVAISEEWQRADDGADLYLVTCSHHSLADVFNHLHRRTA